MRYSMLETTAIKMYLTKYKVEYIPIDTYECPKSYDENIDYMNDRLVNSPLRESFDLRNFIAERPTAIGRYGFDFLNSDYSDRLHAQCDRLIGEILKIKNDERLFRLNELNDEVLGRREDVMLTNVYDYSRKHGFNKALFFIGSGHRRSVLRKIKQHNEQEKLKLNWILLRP